METIIHQALGNVFFADAGQRFQWSQIKDAFVSHPAIAPAVEHRERTR